jgi:hypothetical protein
MKQPRLRLFLPLLGVAALAAQGPAPTVQNGRVDTRPATSIDAAIRAAGVSSEPAWIAWREPMVDGDRRACSTWSDGDTTVRGIVLEPRRFTDGRPQIAPSTGPAQLEAGTNVIVLLRVIDGRVERLRTISDDCPIDANGRTVTWLSGVNAADSLRYLGALTQPATLTAEARRQAQSAITAIALHRDAGADALLDRLMASGADTDLRDSATRALAAYRGHHGFEQVSRAMAAERNASARQRVVSALRQSSDPEAAQTLLTIAQTDTSERVRAEAVLGYAVLAGAPGVPRVIDLASKDASPDVQRRAVSGIARLPSDVSVPALLSIARSSATAPMRKEAVAALTRADDPRATKYLEEIVAK